LPKSEDDTEIVIVSDTVRQRRSRTPISVTTDTNRESNFVALPDLLSNADEHNGSSDFSHASKETHPREDKASATYNDNDSSHGQIVDTVNILESCNRLQPQQVETVHIIDASSDTDTATSTPLLPRKSFASNNGSIDELKFELRQELETVAIFDTEDGVDAKKHDDVVVKRQRISYEERKQLEKDRDLLRDSEGSLADMKLRPTLKELWMEERNSFYDNDVDEPLEFSDDEEIPRYSIEMGSDSDLVEIFIKIS
jgi:hypothetical protein